MKLFTLLFALASAPPAFSTPFEKAPSLEPPPWPAWAHEHWVWENEGTEDSAEGLVTDYLRHDIPVSALIIDRPWDTVPSNFVPDPARYPHLGALVQRLHGRNVKVMLWAVSLINQNAPEFGPAKEKGYFVNGGKTVKWWAGHGALVDYNNPAAVDWWHGRMNSMLDLGIDGWKLDAIDPFSMVASSDSFLGGIAQALMGALNSGSHARKTWDAYRTAYYGDFLDYSRKRTGKKIVITARPVDALEYVPMQFSFAPYPASFAGWVGDQDGNWKGLGVAISNMKESANRGFLSFGSDTTGFRSSGGKREPELFIRWSQLSAFNGVFENGGSGEHRPWAYDKNVEDSYRKLVKIHHALVPYIYSSTAWAFENGHSLYVNLEAVGLRPPKSSQWDYYLGPNLFVASIADPGGSRRLRIPPGRWIPFFDPSRVVNAGVQTMNFSLDEYPVFVREGAILPLRQGHEHGPLRAPSAEPGALDVVIFPKLGNDLFPIYQENRRGGMLSYDMPDPDHFRFRADRAGKLGWLRLPITDEQKPRRVKIQGREINADQIKASNGALWIPLMSCGEGACEALVEWR